MSDFSPEIAPQSFLEDKLVFVSHRDDRAGKILSPLLGEALWEHTDLFQSMSDHVLGALPKEDHFGAVLDILDWWSALGVSFPLSVIPPSNPASKGMWHARLTKNSSFEVPGWKRLESRVLEWAMPDYPHDQPSEMWSRGKWSRDEAGWERLVDAHLAKCNVNLVKRPGCAHLIEQSLANWLDCENAPVIMAGLHFPANGVKKIDHFDVTKLLLGCDDGYRARAVEFCLARQPQHLAQVLYEIMGKDLEANLYEHVSVELCMPSDAWVSQRIANKLALQTQQATQPSRRRSL